MTVKLLALAGSTREGSFNQRLLDLACAAAEAEGATVTRVRLADYALPLYSHELEATAFPRTALDLKAQFVAHHGFLIASPEHNGSVSAVLKNAIDWVSRPTEAETAISLTAFRGKTAGIMSASISPFGGLRSLTHLRQILGTVQTLAVTEQVLVPFADKAFDGPELVDALPRMLLGGLAKRVVEVTDALNR
ncbi:NADPH-dependent FMN reductase [Caulobacter mirabilis]|uniref:NADPH-dependent FMN reductase n=1 Tax=Caulobacter mirabilis TaxID=69666 RepID=A0A2D2B1Q5_9CAUL|nr:NAD(P)H-dependent oxidoreductase [Caulobacter mirabilis]ATQ44147.1 NADPH-dependent FMN reductase [Caulobacter mirabilis]